MQPDNLQYTWWRNGVIYQMYPRSFQDTNADGVGDLQGIIECLNYLNDGTPDSLGVDAIWISPFYPSPMKDFGYDVSNYTDVHPLFGDLKTFDRLVQEAHKRNIRVIIDYVPNHTSDQHPWFIESRSSRENPKRDWYIWRDAKPNGARPNNWGSNFGGPAWTWDEKTGQYYMHQFLPEQPDLNWRNPEVRQAMMDVLRFWLEHGVDGFRMDVVGMIVKDKEFRDNPLNEQAPQDIPEYEIFRYQQQLYNMDQPEMFEIIHDFRKLLEGDGNDRLAIGEVWSATPIWVRYYGEHGEGLHLPFNFRLIDTPWEARSIRASVEHLESALPPFAWPNYVLGNHDQARLASRVGQAGARLAAMLLLTLRGTPTLYYGDELALPNGIITPEQLQDPQGKNLGLKYTRDMARTPLQWDPGPYAGFSTVPPWLPVSPDYQTRNVQAMGKQVGSILNLYRRLLWLRRKTPALYMGSYESMNAGDDDIYAYLRQAGKEHFLIVLNFSAQPKHLRLPEKGRGTLVLSTGMDRQPEELHLPDLAIGPNEGLLIRLDEHLPT